MLPALDIAQWLRDDGLLTRWHRSKVPSSRQQESRAQGTDQRSRPPDSRSHAPRHRPKVPSSRQQESRGHRSKVPSPRQQESRAQGTDQRSRHPDSRSLALRHRPKVPSSRQQESRSKAQVKGWRDLNLHDAQERHGQEMTFTAQPITSRAAAGGRKDSGDSCLP